MEMELDNNDKYEEQQLRIEAAYSSILADYERQDFYLEFSQLLKIFFKRNLSVFECDSVVARLALAGIKISPDIEESKSTEIIPLPNLNLYQDIHVKAMEKIISHKLLNSLEEQELSRYIKMGQRAEEEITNGAEATQSHSELIKSANAARKKLVLSNIRLVMHVSRQYFGVSSLTPDDLLQEGICGLIRAIETFDGQLGYKFSTYATWWIKQSLSRSIMNTGGMVRLPVHVYDKIRQFNRAKKFLKRIYFYRDVTVREIAAELSWEIDETHFIMELAESICISMSESGEDDEGNFFSRTLVCELDTPEEYYEKIDFIRAIGSSLSFLSPREKKIIQLRFGMIGDEEGCTLEEIGKMYNLTRERIRQIEEKALKKIRKKCLINDGFILSDFMPEDFQLEREAGNKNE